MSEQGNTVARTDDAYHILDAIAQGRCYACGWTLAKTDGCMPFNCSFRPSEHDREYRNWHARMLTMGDVRNAAMMAVSDRGVALSAVATTKEPDWTALYWEIESNGEGSAEEMVKRAYLKGQQSQLTALDGTLATQINALPQPLRQFVHDLETKADLGGTVRQNVMLRDRDAQLQSALSQRDAEIAALKECVRAADVMRQPSMLDSRYDNETCAAYDAARAKVNL